jgi:hypothetical protein
VSKPTKAWREFRARLDIKDDGGKRFSKDGDRPVYKGNKSQRIGQAVAARIARNRQPVPTESFL